MNYKLYAEVHELDYFIICSYNGKIRYIEDEEDVTEDELLYGHFNVVRNTNFHHYKLIADNLINYGGRYKIGEDIKMNGIVFPIIKIEDNNIYSSCICEIIDMNNEDKIKNIIGKILFKRDNLFEKMVEEADDILEESSGRIMNLVKKITNKINIWEKYKYVNKKKGD